MKQYEKEIIQLQINHEKDILKELKEMYEEAEKQIDDKIQQLMADEQTQSKIYQLEYQKAIKGQISTILDNMNSHNYDYISDYLKQCYEDGYLSTMYSLHKQGIPLILPIDQEMVVKAIQLDSKLSKPLYESLGINVNDLKKAIRHEVSRGISNGYSYRDIARNIRNQMGIDLNKSIRIARTEGHRVNQQSTMDGIYAAKEKGADIVKQWDSTLDKKTRPSHQRVDGEIREIDERFSNGLMFPGDPEGSAGEVINCRCVLLQRARWAIDDETGNTKWDNENRKLLTIDSKNYQDFKNKYYEELNSRIEKEKQKAKDENEYVKIVKLLGENAPSNIEKYREIKYNQNKDEMFKAYAHSIEIGELTPLADFELYQSISNTIDTEVIGLVTSNGIEIKGKSNHFIVRVIGSVEKKRNGVEISKVIDALTNPDQVDDVKTNKNGRSQRFIKGDVAVTVNPDTGQLIQTNPIREKKKGE